MSFSYCKYLPFTDLFFCAWHTVMWTHYCGTIQQPKGLKAAMLSTVKNSWLSHHRCKAWFLHEARLTNNMKTIWWETGGQSFNIMKLNWEHCPRAVLVTSWLWCMAKPICWLLFSYLTFWHYQLCLGKREASSRKRFPANERQHLRISSIESYINLHQRGICYCDFRSVLC